MRDKLRITLRSMPSSPFIEARIEEAASKLREIDDQITDCHVTVEAQHRHHHKGQIFHVRIDLTVPGGEIVVSREPERDHAHEDVYVAIRDAFDAAKRQLLARARRWNHGGNGKMTAVQWP